MATKAELDRWVTACPIGHAFRLSTSGPVVSPAWTDFKTGIAEMKRLRNEMMRLRTEAVMSLEALQDRLAFMQGLSAAELQQLSPARPGAGRLFSVSPVRKWPAPDSYHRQAG
jgi:hypothetical protein